MKNLFSLATVLFLGCTTSFAQTASNADYSEFDFEGDSIYYFKINLDDVTVSAKKPVIKMEADKVTYNVQEDSDAKSNSILEMLRKVPMVNVDAQDNITVNGSSSFVVYVDGKPSPMFSANPSEILKAMPADGVKNIEVLTNPGAKFDAEGVGGVLNITMEKHNDMDGYTMTLRGNGGDRMNGGGVYSMIQKGKSTVSVNLNANHMEMPESSVEMVREQANSTTKTATTSGGNMNMIMGSVDYSYAFDEHNTVSANLGVNSMKNHNTSEGNMDFSNASGYDMTTDTHMKSNSFNASVDYQHTFDNPQQNLTAAYRVSTSPSENHNVSDYTSDFIPTLDMTNKNRMTEQTIQVDYVQPLENKQTIETGIKYTLRDNSSETATMDYENKQNIAAAYGTYNVSIGSFSIKTGLRYEHTSQDVTYRLGDGEDFSLNYDNLVPNVTLSYSPFFGRNFGLTYNQRISRPGIDVLNPYVNRQNPTSISYGNPDLDVEKVHNIQGSYSYFSSAFTLNASLSYNYQDKGIQQYSFFDNNGVMNTTYGNVATKSTTSLSLFSTWSPSANTRITFNGSASYSDLSSSVLGYSNSGWQGSLMVNLQQTLPGDIKLSAMYFGNTPTNTLQGKTSGINMHSIGLSRTFLDDRLTISVNAVSPFSKNMTMKTTTTGHDFSNESTITIPMRSFSATVSWRIGKLKPRQTKSMQPMDDGMGMGSMNMGGIDQIMKTL